MGIDVDGPGGGGDGRGVGTPENMSGGDETLAMGGHVVGLAQQVGEGKADVEGRIAEMEDFVVECEAMACIIC